MSKKARLTSTQQGLYFESINDPSGIVYNNAFLAKLSDKTDIDRFIGALKTTVKAHPSFSVRFGAESDGTLFQEYDGQNCVPVDVFRMSNEEFAGVRKGIVRPFDLNGGCLFRFEIYITPGGNYFFMDSHHTVFDGVSYYVLQNELQTVYNGGTVECEKLDGLDAALYEEELLAGEYRTEAKNYYEELLGARDADCLPLRDAYGETQEKSKLSIYFDVDSEAFKALREKAGVSATGFFTTVMGHVVARYSNRTDSVIATLFNGRNETNKDVFAMMVRTIPFVTDLSAETKIEELLKKQQSQLKTNRKYCVYPFGELAADHGVNSDILFTYQGRLMDFTVMNDPNVKSELLEHESAGKIAFLLNETDNGSYKLEAMFRSDLYSEDFIRGMAKAFIKASGEYLKREYIGEIEMADEEAVGLINAFNATEADYPERKTVVELFREQAKKTPENLCLVSGENKYTYSQIDEITDRFARVLAGKGIGREKVAGILIPRNEYMLICALSVLKAGGAYMPLDPTYPPERLKLMLEDSGAVLLITTPELDSAVTADYDIAKIMADDISAMEGSDAGLPCPEVNDLAVLLYTSGSTGVPKGVMWEHGNITVLIEWVKKYYKMGENSNVAGCASFGFDANIYESYPAVTSGAALYVIPDELRLELASLRDYFNSVGMTHAVLTTQVGRQLALIGGFDTLKHLTVAGEKLTPLDPPKDINLYNVYGPTEGSCATSAFKMDKYYSDVPIGKPLDNLKAYVVDANGRLLPAGAVGELWISGPHVTRGYLNRPEKTAEAYGDNPFSTQPGYERIYRTGDVVRYLAGGDLQFVGRRDAQVKIRGFRIELTEVEEVVRRCPKVKDATVAAFDDPSGGKFIAAYVVSDEEVTYDEVTEFIRAEKPPYMVPAVIMQIDKIPLNQNQKVNKKALPVPERKFENTVPPQNETQQAIFDILAEVLGHSAFGINTDIYEAGLSSVGTVRLNVMLAERFEVPVKISDLRANPTVEKLEAFFAGAEKADEYSVQEDYPITRTQNGIFVECTANADSTVYNIPVLFRLADGIDPERLTEAVRAAINAHPYLKTTLCLKDGDIRARRNDSAEPAVEYIKCEKLPEPSALLRPFRLLDSALYRAGVYDTSDGLYLFADIHHIISDGVSERILFDDISKAYAGGVPVKESYTGFEAALDEQKARESERFGAAAAYYEKLLKGRETECMPAKSPSDDSSGAGTFTFESDLDPAAVSDFCDSAELTANAFFNAVFGFVLSRFTFREDAVFTTIYNGRSDSRLARSTAMMVKTIPVAADAEDEKTVREYTAAIQNQLMNSMANDIYSFEEISGAYGVRADVMFIYQGDSFELDTLCGKPAEVITVASDTAKAPVSINVYIKNGKYHLVAEYRREIYCEELVRSLTESVCEAAKSFIKCERLCDVEMLPASSEAIYEILNDNDTEFENIPCTVLFERQVRLHPESPAVTAAGETLTFGELDRLTNILANKLISLGIKADDIVGIVLDRTKEAIIAELGIMKSGGAFLPMIPSYPDDRIGYCLTNAGSPAVITTRELLESRNGIFGGDKPCKCLAIEELLADGDASAPCVDIKPDSLAYCIYTSGSTGMPKGVMIEHHNGADFVQTHKNIAEYYRSDSFTGAALGLSSISFDMSLYNILMSLCTGKHYVMATEEEIHNPLRLIELMVKNNVQMMVCTPSFITNIIDIPEFTPAVKNLVNIIVGAEAFPSALYDRLRTLSPSLHIINGYGPTECTICCSAKELSGGGNITIGRPTGNVRMYVADKHRHILPAYAAGELVICGENVGRGYIGLPEKNEEVFIELRGMRAYRAGDLVRLTGDAEIGFFGRTDNQVKLRGFRVELDEIENTMGTYPGIKQSKVVVRNNGSEDYLAGFFTAADKVDIDSLTEHLKSRLTYYMVPAVLLQLDEMPLTANGKIDKKALPEVKKTAAKRSAKRAPKKSLEQKLCDMFASVLGAEEYYADDDFFEMGGTSLSASKITMLLMSEGIEVEYGDIFSNPTPAALAEHIEAILRPEPAAVKAESTSFGGEFEDVLRFNTTEYTADLKRESIGDVLLTGAVGYLGIHVLRELIDLNEGHIYCLIRRGRHGDPVERLKMLLMYYFDDTFDSVIENNITVIDADITDGNLGNILKDIHFDTLINCAACVKHFASDDILERVNVTGVENLIGLCKSANARMVHISTTSIPGIHTPETYEKRIKMHENELFVIDAMFNKYVDSKYRAEKKLLEAVRDGLRGRIIRVGNLMGRYSDGEFQINFNTNMFFSGIRGFAAMGMYPISHMTDPMSFSPIDCTARAIVLLAGADDKFTAFNADNRYGFDEMKIIDACCRNGISIAATEDREYYEEYHRKLGDERFNKWLNGLAAYDRPDLHAVETDNLFTANVLYRMGFSWPLTDDAYLDRVVKALKTLGYFDI